MAQHCSRCRSAAVHTRRCQPLSCLLTPTSLSRCPSNRRATRCACPSRLRPRRRATGCWTRGSTRRACPRCGTTTEQRCGCWAWTRTRCRARRGTAGGCVGRAYSLGGFAVAHAAFPPLSHPPLRSAGGGTAAASAAASGAARPPRRGRCRRRNPPSAPTTRPSRRTPPRRLPAASRTEGRASLPSRCAAATRTCLRRSPLHQRPNVCPLTLMTRTTTPPR